MTTQKETALAGATSPKVPQVYTAISAVTERLAKSGISKDRKNKQQGYNFRGIDDIYDALAAALHQSGLCIIPNVISRTVTEKKSKSGGTLFYVVLDVRYDFVSAIDGSSHTAQVVGEAMDSGDKASNKAMSAAYKYVCLQTFCIPTEGENDADATTHEVASPPTQQAAWTGPASKQELLETYTGLMSFVTLAASIADMDHIRTMPIYQPFKDQASADWPGLLTGEKDRQGLAHYYQARYKELQNLEQHNNKQAAE